MEASYVGDQSHNTPLGACMHMCCCSHVCKPRTCYRDAQGTCVAARETLHTAPLTRSLLKTSTHGDTGWALQGPLLVATNTHTLQGKSSAAQLSLQTAPAAKLYTTHTRRTTQGQPGKGGTPTVESPPSVVLLLLQLLQDCAQGHS